MRLTKAMKDSLFTIIKNKTTSPFTSLDESTFQKELQEIIYEEFPVLKQYIDTFGECSAFKHALWFTSENYVNTYLRINLYVNLPDIYNAGAYHFLLKPENLHLQDDYRTKIINITLENLDKFKDRYTEVFTKILNKFTELEQYRKTLDELNVIIDSFTTDTALAQAYPEFEQFFLQAGITNKPKKALPSVTGLPDVLTKYGVKLSPDTDTLAEEIKKEMKEDE